MSALKKIMLVENEEEIRDAACLCLGDLGEFEIISCASGQEALDKFPETQPQLILLDVMMPGINGLITLQRLRRLPGGDTVPVVFMTARAHSNQISEYMSLGAAGVIAKPFDPVTIMREITAIWDSVSGSGAA